MGELLLAGNTIIVGRKINNEAERNQSFMYSCSRGIPSLMLSNGGHGRIEQELVEPLVTRCKNVMKHLKMIPGELKKYNEVIHLDGIFYVFSTEGGLVVNEVVNGDWLRKNQTIARIYNLFGEEIENVVCPYEKAIIIETATGTVNPGDLIGEFFLPKQ